MRFLLAILVSVIGSQAASITVAWDASLSTNVTGYRVFYRTSTNVVYSVFQSQNAYGLQHTITNLAWGTNYWIVATAVDSNGVQSDFSNEITASTPKPLPPTNLRVITNSLQGAARPEGPWTNVASYAVAIPNGGGSAFYRGALDWGLK